MEKGPYNAGFQAYFGNTPEHMNPYPRGGEDYDKWWEGWTAAKEKAMS